MVKQAVYLVDTAKRLKSSLRHDPEIDVVMIRRRVEGRGS